MCWFRFYFKYILYEKFRFQSPSISRPISLRLLKELRKAPERGQFHQTIS